MKRNLLLLFSLAITLFLKAQDTTWYREDFQNGIPESFKLYDEDGLKPSSQVAEFGFAVGTAWVPLRYGDTNVAAASTSFYTTSGASDDWLVTPGFKVEKEGGALVWKGLAADPSYPDGYSVYISTTGNTVADFKDEAVFTIKAESADWATHSVSLDAYVGKTIYVAYVNKSAECFILFIDDIFAGIPSTHTLANTTATYYPEEGDKDITFSVTGGPTQGIGGFTAELSYAGKTVEQTFTSKVDAGKTVEFVFDEKIPLPQGQSVNYKITLKATGNQPDLSLEGTLICFSGDFDRKVVMEEGTGTWCGWCPRGTVSIREMNRLHPDDFIGIAVHSGDPMQVDEYAGNLTQYVTAFPGALINRKFVTDPYTGNRKSGLGIEEVFYQEKELPTIGELQMEAAYSMAEVYPPRMNVTLKGKFGFTTDRANLRYAIVLLENGVVGKNTLYNQANNYAGGRQGEMGGFESLPSKIPAAQMVYDHVARAIYESYDGIPNSIPTSITAGEEVVYQCEISLPDYREGDIENYVFNNDAVELVGFILDGETGEIWNAARLKNSQIGGVNSISGLASSGFSVKPMVTGGSLNVEVTGQGAVKVSLYGTDGTLLASQESVVSGNGILSLPVAGLKGIYVVKTSCGGQVVINKVAVK